MTENPISPGRTVSKPTAETEIRRHTEQHEKPLNGLSRHIPLKADEALKNRCVCAFPDGAELDIYKVLRTRVQQRMAENGWKTLMITSACPGEGKTLTAINLAYTFSLVCNRTALLLDCDLRRQSIHKYLGIDNAEGLADYFLDDAPIKDIMVWPGVENLIVISGFRTVHQSTEFIGSQKMNELIQEMKGSYPDRYLIIDTPPVLSGADAIALAPLIDCILMVVEAGKTPLKDVKRSVEMLPEKKFLGFAINKGKKNVRKYQGPTTATF